MALNLIRPYRFKRLLDIGYGSGILFPELSHYADQLYGVDIHHEHEKVKSAIKKYNIDAELKAGNILNLPYEDGEFDGVVCISVLEHIRDLPRAINEIHRVLTKKGIAIFGFPVRNRLTSSFYSSVGFDYKTHHPSDHRSILVELSKQLKMTRCITYPEILPMDFGLYVCCRCQK
ncbi:MAG: class I SAM-dependent methyltransferase [candidate division WOR-3 bacterium]